MSTLNLSNLDDIKSKICKIVYYKPHYTSIFVKVRSDKKKILKLSFFTKTEYEACNRIDKIDDNPHLVESKILELFNKKILDTNLSPCIVKLNEHTHASVSKLMRQNCDEFFTLQAENISQLVEKIFCIRHNLVKHDIAHDHFGYIDMELCDITLSDYLVKYSTDIIGGEIVKSIIFHIIFTFYIITDLYPSFKHNDLHSENVMLKIDSTYQFNPKKATYMSYKYNDYEFYVPYFGVIPKIIDFGFSSIKELKINNSMEWGHTKMYYSPKLDILRLFYDIYHQTDNKSIEYLVETLDTTEFYRSFNIEIVNKANYSMYSYKDLVDHPIWDIYTEKPKKSQIIEKYGN